MTMPRPSGAFSRVNCATRLKSPQGPADIAAESSLFGFPAPLPPVVTLAGDLARERHQPPNQGRSMNYRAPSIEPERTASGPSVRPEAVGPPIALLSVAAAVAA